MLDANYISAYTICDSSGYNHMNDIVRDAISGGV